MNNPYEQAEDGAQTANVPTLAWVGEDVRLVACDDNIAPLPFDGQFQQAEWNTNLWTGDQATQSTPTFDGSQATNLFITNQGSAYFFFPNGADTYEKGCVSADISSLHAGLDEVTLNVYNENVGGGDTGIGGPYQRPVYSEQFIVIWMTANTPSLSEATLSSIENPTQADGTANTAVFPSTGPNPGHPSDPGGAGQLSGTGVKNATAFLGDLAVENQFGLDKWGQDVPWDPSAWDGGANNTPTSNNGLLQVRVTGSFPIEDQPPATTNANFFAPVTGGGNPSTITLPKQWPALANLMAASSTQYAANNGPGGGQLWDIHGGPTNPLGHASSGTSSDPCHYDGTLFNQTTDAVDDCANDGTGHGNAFSFSRVFGDMTQFGTIGPYDALASNATLLSDGRLNSDDAPMPALPVTLTIAKGGIGGLYGVSKRMVYSHDFNTDVASPEASGTAVNNDALTTTGLGNYYNPFYEAYIPSTLRPIAEASGVTGVYEGEGTASSGDDFPGFSLGWTDPYTYWKALDASTTDSQGYNACLRAGGGLDDQESGGVADKNNGGDWDPGSIDQDDYYSLPYYPTSITVYTDERGEAYADYNPGTGFNTPNIPIDNNGACDLQGLLGKSLGTAAITAQAQYPYESVPYATPAVSTTVTKNVISQWSKTLAAYPKNNLSGGPGGANVSIVVATATDVNGQPFVGETVCFSTSAGALSFESSSSITTPGGGTISLAGSEPAKTPLGFGSSYLCGITGTNGTVAVEVAGSGGVAADVIASFVNEHLFRDVLINSLGQTTTATSTTPPTVLPADKVVLASGSSSAGVGGDTVSGITQGQQVTITTAIPGSGASCKVAAFHMFAKKGYATVRLSCSGTKSDYVLVRTFKGRKLVHTFKLRITAGKTVRIHIAKGRRITVSPA